MKMRTFRHLRTLTSKLSSRIRQKRLVKKFLRKFTVEQVNMIGRYLEAVSTGATIDRAQLIKSLIKSNESEVRNSGEPTKKYDHLQR